MSMNMQMNQAQQATYATFVPAGKTESEAE